MRRYLVQDGLLVCTKSGESLLLKGNGYHKAVRRLAESHSAPTIAVCEQAISHVLTASPIEPHDLKSGVTLCKGSSLPRKQGITEDSVLSASGTSTAVVLKIGAEV